MVMMCDVWSFVSSTGVNSVLTFISIVLAIYALCTAKKTKIALEEYSRNLKKSEFLNYVTNFHKLYKKYQQKETALEGNIEKWNIAGNGDSIIKTIIETKTEINEYYDTIPLPKTLKDEFEKLNEIVGKFKKEQPSIDRLLEIDVQLNIIDKALKKVAQSMKLNMLS